MKKLSYARFRTPRAISSPGYFWILNAPLESETIDAQLEDFRAHGVRSICIHPCPRRWSKYSRMSPEYLSDEYMKALQAMVRKCSELGICFYLYDEGGYPSGSAAGMVVQSDPVRFAQQGVNLSPDGKSVVRNRDEELTFCSYPNLIARGATEKFIELTHEKYRQYLGEYFGRNIFYAFTDEPRCPRFPMDHNLSWCDDFEEQFQKRKGYSLAPYLPDVIRGKATTDRDRLQHRIDYFDVCSQLFVERYFIPLRDWCRGHGIKSGGHLGGENSPEGNYYFAYMHILRDLRAMDLPGVDVIWRQIYPKTRPATKNSKAVPRKFDPIYTGAKSHPFTKYASSVAHQNGQSDVLSETFAVYGFGLKPDVMRYLTDYQMVRGVTRFVLSNIPMEIRGASMLGCHPYFGPSNPLWKYFDLYHAYTSRMCEVLSAGQPDVHIALYYDIRSIWCGGKTMADAIRQHERTAEQLLARQCDFDFVDDDLLQGGRVVGSALQLGKMRYDTIVMPHSDWVSPLAQSRLDALRKAGGRVLYPEDMQKIAPTIVVTPTCKDIRVHKRRMPGGGVLYFVTSESPDTLTVQLNIAETGSMKVLDPEQGKVFLAPGEGSSLMWTFAPYHSLALLVNSDMKTDGELPCFTPGRRMNLKDGWQIQPVHRYYVGDDRFEEDKTAGKAVPCSLGDWRPVLGAEFSGEAKYTLRFQSIPGQKCQLHLGKVCYACTVFLNGRQLGRRLWGPFVFDIPSQVLKRQNTLEIHVTNTFANAVNGPSAENIWRKYYPDGPDSAPYHAVIRQFDADSLPSGLFGPVHIVFSDKVI